MVQHSCQVFILPLPWMNKQLSHRKCSCPWPACAFVSCSWEWQMEVPMHESGAQESAHLHPTVQYSCTPAPLHSYTPVPCICISASCTLTLLQSCTLHTCTSAFVLSASLNGLIQHLPYLLQGLVQRGQGQEDGAIAPQGLSATICTYSFDAHYSWVIPG